MGDTLELKTFPVVNDNNNVSTEQAIEVIPGNGTNEASHLLLTPQVTENDREPQDIAVEIDSSTETSRCQREILNQKVVWKLKLWMVISLIVSLIALVIVISVIVCAVEEDADEKFDKASFVVERFFKGNFSLDSSSLASHPLDHETVREQLKQQLTEVYNSSPALERYFSNVTVSNFQNTTAQFELQFMMPLDHEELVGYTLSLKMVKNVLLQHFYDQDRGGRLYVIPTSLRMEDIIRS